jgi:peroxiredoxin
LLKPGAEAPDFRIGEAPLSARLASGPVAVFFFPKAFTSG